MGERETQIDRDGDLDIESEVDTAADTGLDLDTGIGDGQRGDTRQSGAESTDTGVRGRVKSRAGSLVSSGGLVAGIVLSLLGIFLVNAIPLVGSIRLIGLLGIPMGTFVHGLVREDSRYVEAMLGGAIAGGGAVLLSVLFLALFGVGTGLVGIATVGGAIAGGVGHYFGRDFKSGLSRDVN